MRLAFAEMRRSTGRFVAIATAVGFIAFLALILSALGDGLYRGQTGLYRTSDASLFVFSVDSGDLLPRSTLDPSLERAAAAVSGVTGTGLLGTSTLPATLADGTAIQLSLVGASGVARPSVIRQGRWPDPGADEILADQQLLRRGVGMGDTVSINGGPDLTIVGVARDAGFGFDTAWTSIDTWNAARSAVRPELGGATTVQAIAVAGSPTTAALTAIGNVTVATPAEAIAALPGADQQRTTIDGIVNTTFVVAALVIGLFFALVTIEKRSQFAVLKAIGMRNRTLLVSVVVQAIVASAVGFAGGLALARIVGAVIPADVPALFLTTTAVSVAGTTLVTGTLGAVFSFRRITSIDPATALGGAE